MSAERKLKQRPVLVLFYMDGCKYCAQNEKAWKEAKKKYGGTTVEIEAAEVPPSENVTSFPTMKYMSEGGNETMIAGAQSSGDEILQKLEVPLRGGRRRRATRRTHYRRNRKLRHRTLRNHVPLV